MIDKNSDVLNSIDSSFVWENLTPEDYLELAELCKQYAQLRQESLDEIAAEELEEYDNVSTVLCST